MPGAPWTLLHLDIRRSPRRVVMDRYSRRRLATVITAPNPVNESADATVPTAMTWSSAVSVG